MPLAFDIWSDSAEQKVACCDFLLQLLTDNYSLERSGMHSIFSTRRASRLPSHHRPAVVMRHLLAQEAQFCNTRGPRRLLFRWTSSYGGTSRQVILSLKSIDVLGTRPSIASRHTSSWTRKTVRDACSWDVKNRVDTSQPQICTCDGSLPGGLQTRPMRCIGMQSLAEEAFHLMYAFHSKCAGRFENCKYRRWMRHACLG